MHIIPYTDIIRKQRTREVEEGATKTGRKGNFSGAEQRYQGWFIGTDCLLYCVSVYWIARRYLCAGLDSLVYCCSANCDYSGLFFMCYLDKSRTPIVSERRIPRSTLTGMLVLVCVWAYLSGIGGLVYQNGDHPWRNSIFKALVE